MLLFLLIECLALLFAAAGLMLAVIPSIFRRGRRGRVRNCLLKAAPCFAVALILTLGLQAACDGYQLTAADTVTLSTVRGAVRHRMRFKEPLVKAWTGLVWLDRDKDGTAVIVVRRNEKSLSEAERLADKLFRMEFTMPRKFRTETPLTEKGGRIVLRAGTPLKPLDRCEICSWSLAQLRFFRSAAKTGSAAFKSKSGLFDVFRKGLLGRRWVDGDL